MEGEAHQHHQHHQHDGGAAGGEGDERAHSPDETHKKNHTRHRSSSDTQTPHRTLSRSHEAAVGFPIATTPTISIAESAPPKAVWVKEKKKKDKDKDKDKKKKAKDKDRGATLGRKEAKKLKKATHHKRVSSMRVKGERELAASAPTEHLPLSGSLETPNGSGGVMVHHEDKPSGGEGVGSGVGAAGGGGEHSSPAAAVKRDRREEIVSMMQQRCLQAAQRRELRRNQRILLSSARSKSGWCVTIFLGMLFLAVVISVEYYVHKHHLV